MYLTNEEEQMLKGEYGPAVQKAMQILVALGEIYEAEKMLLIRNVHMPGSSVIVAGDAGTSFVKETAETGVLFKTYTTLNPAAIDLKRWRNMGIPEYIAEKQVKLTEAYRRMGAICSHTCTPYLAGNLPKIKEHIAWGESSAIVFSNSVLGARTNREGGPSALASALTGRTPLYGFHLKENRRGTILVRINAELKDVTDYGTLGYYIGSMCKEKTPVFKGIPRNVTLDQLKMLGAALASSGAAALYHVVGVTPEARTEEEAFQGDIPLETVDFGVKELRETEEMLSKATENQIDITCLGCPHSSIEEIREVAELLAGRKIHPDVKLWVCTSLSIKSIADRMGYTQIIEKSGGMVICDTCPVLAPTKEIVRASGYKTIATNSAKLAHYAPGQCNLSPFYGKVGICIESSIKGRWTG
jgi:hypothetical protein